MVNIFSQNQSYLMFLVKTMTVFTSKKKYRYSIQITLFHWLSGCFFFYQFLILCLFQLHFLMVGILKEQNVNKTMLYEFPLLHAKQKYLIKFQKNVEIDIISSSSLSFCRLWRQFAQHLTAKECVSLFLTEDCSAKLTVSYQL